MLKSFYIDIRFFDGSSVTYDHVFNIFMSLVDGTCYLNVHFVDDQLPASVKLSHIEYLGYGDSVEYDLGVHLPITLFKSNHRHVDGVPVIFTGFSFLDRKILLEV